MQQHVARFRFYAELRDFLPETTRRAELPYAFRGSPSIKHAIEALGVPHAEVDLILVNGRSVAFDYSLRPGDRVSVYPVFESLDISPVGRLRPRPLRRTRFVVDGHLGKLARLLRMLGFDTSYRADCGDSEIVRISLAEGRIILTRDRGILRRKAVTHAYYVRSIHAREQLLEVLRRFDLGALLEPFQRCMICNGVIGEVAKEAILDRVPAGTRAAYEEFHVCSGCDRVYWRGPHHAAMTEYIRRLFRDLDSGG
ncbi:MAG: Mut7-C RNAse domain-containing protein [Planctomycetota bacterium]